MAGTATAGDSFGFAAESIGKFVLGTTTLTSLDTLKQYVSTNDVRAHTFI